MGCEEREDWPSSELADKYVCTCHFDDKYINEFIKEKGQKGKCSYCGKRGVVCDMETLGKHFAFHINEYFSPLDDADLMLANGFYDNDDEVILGLKKRGPYVAPEENTYYDSKSEMLSNLDLYTDSDELNEDVESIFTTEEWISKDMYDEDNSVRFSNLWDGFVEYVSKKRRFTFLATPDYMPMIGGKGEFRENILMVLHSLINESGLCETLPKGTVVYRARKVDDATVEYGFNDITAAPDDKAFPNRMSPAGISYVLCLI